MKILIVGPHLNIHGGVSDYLKYLTLELKNINYVYLAIGKRENKQNVFSRFINIPVDLMVYLWFLIKNKYDIIHLNPSLKPFVLNRDLVYLIFAKIFQIKTVVFIHGWNEKYEKRTSRLSINIKLLLFLSDEILVLAKIFQKKILTWGYSHKPYIVSTMIEKNTLRHKIVAKNINALYRLLFLARVEKEKGIFETIESFKLLKERDNRFMLYVAGEGQALEEAVEYVKKNNIRDVVFLGHIRGKKKKELFRKTGIYIFPSCHGEGKPLSLMEAMGYGLVVITTIKGGIKQFFKNGKMGVAIKKREPKVIAGCIWKIIHNNNVCRKISVFNQRYAKKYFSSDINTKQIVNIYTKIMERGDT